MINYVSSKRSEEGLKTLKQFLDLDILPRLSLKSDTRTNFAIFSITQKSNLGFR